MLFSKYLASRKLDNLPLSCFILYGLRCLLPRFYGWYINLYVIYLYVMNVHLERIRTYVVRCYTYVWYMCVRVYMYYCALPPVILMLVYMSGSPLLCGFAKFTVAVKGSGK